MLTFYRPRARKIPSAIWYAGTRLFCIVREGVKASLVLNAIALEFVVAVLTGGWVFIAFQSHYVFLKNYAWVGWGILVLTLLLTVLFLVQPHLLIRRIQRGREKCEGHPSGLLPDWKNLWLVLWSILLLG